MKTVLILRIITVLIGSVITVDALWLFFVSNINAGVILTFFLGIIIIASAVMPPRIIGMIPKWVTAVFVTCICVAVIFASFLIVYGSRDSADFKEDAVIVLGAGVRGRTPSLTLRRRLDKAVEYYEKNPEALIVVSGGQGPGEDITEAEAMETYLIDRGVPPDMIIKEDKSVSTYTNFKNSKKLLDERFSGEYRVVFITNEYHMLRAHSAAKACGFNDATGFHSDTTPSYIIPGSVRECLAVVKYLILGE